MQKKIIIAAKKENLYYPCFFNSKLLTVNPSNIEIKIKY